jgi:hypothetical protein
VQTSTAFAFREHQRSEIGDRRSEIGGVVKRFAESGRRLQDLPSPFALQR